MTFQFGWFEQQPAQLADLGPFGNTLDDTQGQGGLLDGIAKIDIGSLRQGNHQRVAGDIHHARVGKQVDFSAGLLAQQLSQGHIIH